ncbi:MAG: GNAT family protein [Acetobacter sp.]
MSTDLTHWAGAPEPARQTLEGHYARLEPLDPARHAAELLHSALEPGADERFRYLPEATPDAATFRTWIENAALSADPMFFAVIDRATGRAEGRQALMRITPQHGVIEIGHILWGPAIARTRVTTESVYLLASYVFDTLGYRRFEWKCNALNAPSRRAAERFGFRFEGIFRNHMVVKGQNRDTAWFAMTDSDWPRIRQGFTAWLRAENFDQDGQQHTRLNCTGTTP